MVSPSRIIAERIISLPDAVVERFSAYFIEVLLVVHGEHDGGGKRDEVNVAIACLVVFDALQHALSMLSSDGFTTWIVVKDEAQLCEQLVGLRDMRKPVAIAVEIVVNHGGIRFLAFGYMRQ